MTEKIKTNPKASKFKLNDRVRITNYKKIFSRGYTENCSREIFIIDSVLKTSPWTYATDVDTSDLAPKKDFIALKAEMDKLDINKLVNVPTTLNNLKIKIDDLEVGKLKTVPVDLKKLRDVVDNEVVKNRRFNTLKTKK